MIHLGDITKIDGAKAPAVEVVIGGSPCQDLSVAGKRAGLAGERSGLFMEQIRIIKEMRRESERSGATVIIPRYMVWENVPGAFSSNGGEDFRAVLEETARVADSSAAIPRPTESWTNAGAVVGNGWSLAWRVLDAQFWGVPQRRRRIALVADFGGYTAPEILFERNGMSRYSPPSRTSWEDFTATVTTRSGSESGDGIFYDYDRRHNTCSEVEVAPTVCAKYGTGGGNTPLIVDKHDTFCIQGNCIDRADTAGCTEICENLSPILNCAHEQSALCIRERCGCEGGGKGLLVQSEKTGSLATKNDQFVYYSFQGFGNYKKSEAASSLKQRDFKDATDLCFAVDCRNGTENERVNGTLQAKGTGGTSLNLQNVVRTKGIVRRLTPLECERLQGFPDGWTDIGDWIDSKGKQHKLSDSPRYKALGNSIALPPWVWILERLNSYCVAHTMASLFDGIGGFPLIWETLNGRGSCLWCSEIEEICIAVTKLHFGED